MLHASVHSANQKLNYYGSSTRRSWQQRPLRKRKEKKDPSLGSNRTGKAWKWKSNKQTRQQSKQCPLCIDAKNSTLLQLTIIRMLLVLRSYRGSKEKETSLTWNNHKVSHPVLPCLTRAESTDLGIGSPSLFPKVLVSFIFTSTCSVNDQAQSEHCSAWKSTSHLFTAVVIFIIVFGW